MDNLVWRKNPERDPKDPSRMVYVKYRCGVIVGPIECGKRRWVPWPKGPTDWDVAFYALAE